MSDSVNKTFRIPSDLWSDVEAYAEVHGISKAIAARIGLRRLLGKKPTRAELQEAEVQKGRPDIVEYNRTRHAE